MSTEAQIKANRKNTQKSTWPRTEERKEVAAQNALNGWKWGHTTFRI